MEFLMEATGKQGNMMTLIVPFALMFAILYLLIIRPQKRKQKALQEMITNVRKSDNVVTMGGVHGVVVSVKEKEVIIRVDDSKDVKLKIDKSALTSVSVPKSNREED